jgi:hypothetical protein
MKFKLTHNIISASFIAFILFTVILFTVNSGYGQDSIFPKNQIKLSLSKLIDPINSGIEMSYERRFTKRLATQFTGAYLFNLNKVPPFTSYIGIKLAIEEKYYLKHRKYSQKYVSMDFAYNNIKYNTIANFTHNSSNDTIIRTYNDSTQVSKNTYSLNHKFGVIFYIKRLVIDLSIGVGLKYRDAKHTGRINESDFLTKSLSPNTIYYSNIEGKDFLLNVPINIKIGYIF